MTFFVVSQAPSRDLFSAIVKSEANLKPSSVTITTPKSKAGHTPNASCWPLDVDFSPSNLYAFLSSKFFWFIFIFYHDRSSTYVAKTLHVDQPNLIE